MTKTSVCRKNDQKELKRRRKAALDLRKRKMKDAWRHYEKPVLKPSDVVALLAPRPEGTGAILTDCDRQSRVLLVNRFWVEQEERSMHVLFIPGGADLEHDTTGCGMERQSSGTGDCDGGRHSCAPRKCVSDLRQYCQPPIIMSPHVYMYVKEIRLMEAHSGRRGAQMSSPVSSLGTLSTGELYFVYRFVLYWDGFEVQTGREASGEGIYLMCLNFPTDSNRTPNDVRVISLTPPGVKADTVLRAILGDLVEGMTNGYVDVDACGKPDGFF